MARYLAWSLEAVEDIEAIADYIARDSLRYASAVAARLVETAESVPDMPLLGRVVPEIGDDAVVHRYRLIYRVDTRRILIVAVIHGSRLLEPFVGRAGVE